MVHKEYTKFKYMLERLPSLKKVNNIWTPYVLNIFIIYVVRTVFYLFYFYYAFNQNREKIMCSCLKILYLISYKQMLINFINPIPQLQKTMWLIAAQPVLLNQYSSTTGYPLYWIIRRPGRSTGSTLHYVLMSVGHLSYHYRSHVNEIIRLILQVNYIK